MQEWLERVAFRDKELLRRIQQVGIIAGGCVSTPEQCSDVDVFVRELAQWEEIAALITRPWTARTLRHYGKENDGICVIEVQIEGETLPLQVVFSDAAGPSELLEGFDADYVQSAVFQDGVWRTEACARALETKTLEWMRFPLPRDRFEKACKKGFLCPMLLACGEAGQAAQKEELPMEDLVIARIPTLTAPKLLHVSQLCLRNLRPRKTWRKAGRTTIHYFNWVGEDFECESVTFAGHVVWCVSFDETSWFRLEGWPEDITFRARTCVGPDTCVLATPSCTDNGKLRLECTVLKERYRTVPVDFPSLLASFHARLPSPCLRVPGNNLSAIEARVEALGEGPLDQCARMAYECLLHEAKQPHPKWAKAAEQFAYDIHKRFGSDRAMQNLGSDPLSRLVLNGEYRVQLHFARDVCDFIESERALGIPAAGSCVVS